jgi:hypothetical protein
MAKKLDPLLIDILTKHGEDPNAALWDCHGTWVVYHKAIERIAAKAGVVFDMPQIIEANSAGKTVAIAVRGVMGERSEWSFGEAAPSNNKNAYPYAMAEKRAKDRVVLKLVGLHGLAYSEEESDDFKPNAPAPVKSSAQLKRENEFPDFDREVDECQTLISLDKLAGEWRTKASKDGWNQSFKLAAKERLDRRREQLSRAPDDDTFPGDRPSGSYRDVTMAG